MAYCTVDDLKADFKSIEIEDSGTKISTDEAEEIINQVSAYINGRIGVKYVVPVYVSGCSDAMLILKQIAIFLSAERIKNILEIKTNETQMDSEKKYSRNIARTPKDDLELIVKGLLLLPGATLAGSAQGVSSFNSDNCVSHQIDVTRQQW